MERWLKRQGFDQPQDEISDEDAFAALASASIAGRVALRIRAGKRVRRVRRLGGREVKLPPRCAQVGGFNLHAGVVIGAHNREGLERLCRYVARPPLSSKRMRDRELDTLSYWVRQKRRGAWNAKYDVYALLNTFRHQYGLAPVQSPYLTQFDD